MKLITNINANLKDTFRFRLLLILSSVLLIALRQPALLLYPRLWAEEGCIFFEFAYHHSIYKIFTTAHVGYLTLFNSIVSTLQAKVFSVESAATVSTLMGFLVQLIPVYIVVFTTYLFWNTPLKKIICAFITVIVTAPELWLNTTNSHFIFGLITFLIMVVSAIDLSKFQKYFFRLLLFIGGLTGPASIFFTPIFLLKAYKEKTKEKYIQTIIISICAVIQTFVIIYSILYNNKYKRLSERNSWKTTQAFFVDNFSLNFHVDVFHVNFYFGIIISVFFIYFFIKNRKKNEYLIFMLSFILVSIFSTLGSLNMAGSPRYAYIPTCILIILIVAECFDEENIKSKIKYIAPTIFAICLVINCICYFRTMKTVYSPNFPNWKDEVANWRKDSTNYPCVHPGHEIKVKL